MPFFRSHPLHNTWSLPPLASVKNAQVDKAKCCTEASPIQSPRSFPAKQRSNHSLSPFSPDFTRVENRECTGHFFRASCTDLQRLKNVWSFPGAKFKMYQLSDTFLSTTYQKVFYQHTVPHCQVSVHLFSPLDDQRVKPAMRVRKCRSTKSTYNYVTSVSLQHASTVAACIERGRATASN